MKKLNYGILKKYKNNEILGALAVILMLLSKVADGYYQKNLTLLSFFVKMVLDSPIISMIVYVIFFEIITIILEKWRGFVIVKKKLPAYVIVATVVLIIELITPLHRYYDGVCVAGKRPITCVYYSMLVKDLVENETQVVNLPVDQVNIGDYQLRVRVGKGYKTVIIYNLSYTGKDGNIYSYKISESTRNVLLTILEGYDDIYITYYKNSGVVKCINGVDLRNTKEMLKQMAVYNAINKIE